MKKRFLSMLPMVLCVALLTWPILSFSETADKSPVASEAGMVQKLARFAGGLAAVYVKGQWGFIDPDGKMIIQPLYNDVLGFQKNYAAVRIDKKWGFIDKKGKFVINPQFDEARSFSEGLAPVRKGNLWGVIDEKGRIVLDYSFEDLKGFNDGLAPAKRTGKWGFIDKKGRFAISRDWLDAGEFGESLAPVKNLENQWGYINQKGKWSIQAQFDNAMTFQDGLAVVQIDSKWGFINKKGKFVINPFYEGAGSFAEKLATVKINGQWGYVDKKGKLVINPSFDTAGDFSDGNALVAKNGSAFYIGKTGKKSLDIDKSAGAAIGEKALGDSRAGIILSVQGGYRKNREQDVVIINYSTSDLLITENKTKSGGLSPKVIPAWTDWTDYKINEILDGAVSLQFDDHKSSNTDAFTIKFIEDNNRDDFGNYLSTILNFQPSCDNCWIKGDDQMHSNRFATNYLSSDLSAYTVVSPRHTITFYSVNTTGAWMSNGGATLIIVATDTVPAGYDIWHQKLKYVNYKL